MDRRIVLVVPLAALAGVAFGAALSDRVWTAAAVALAGGLVVAAWLSAAARRRVGDLAAAVRRLASGDLPPEPVRVLDPGWEPLAEALTQIGASLSSRLEQLQTERARVESLLETLPPAILLFDAEGLTYANVAARGLFSLQGASLQTPMHVLGVRALADAVTESRETRRAIDVEVERDNRVLLARASLTAQGEVALVISDVTQARRLDAIRSDFVTNASHELKTPAAGMQALADSLSLAFHRDPDRAERMIARLQQEAARLAQLVRDLLDLSRLEEALDDRGRRHVDLVVIVRGQVERLRPLAARRGVRIICDLPEHASLVAVPEDLRLIAANLLENAVRYNRQDGEVRVELRRGEGDVCLTVTDTGIGIAEADRDRIFERFYRVDKARSRAAGGTGLGLSIVRHATRRHGGEISLDSVIGQGSRFRVRLPVAGGGD